MTVALLSITGFCVAVSVVLCRSFLERSRHSQLLTASLTGGQSVASLFCLQRSSFPPQGLSGGQPVARRRIAVKGLTKAEAEDVLDWLEGQGLFGQLSYVEGEGFAVR
jgi:hypothetical protein